jgi:hypothetical protein
VTNLAQVKSELPSTFKAYRHQQHRWTCGAANLFRKMAQEIVTSKASIPECGKKMKLQYRYILNEPLSVDTAGRIRVEEASPSVQLLLCTKGRRPHPDLPVLLRCDPAVGHGP